MKIPGQKTSWFDRLKSGLSKTRFGLMSVFTGQKIDEGFFEQLEDQLLLADCGLPATELILKQLRDRVQEKGLFKPEEAQLELQEVIFELIRPLESNLSVDLAKPTVMMMVGVNGAGKTTSIGKLAHLWSNAGYSVLLAAGDTFRAAAREQLQVWANRSDVGLVSSEGGDPAAVGYDAIQSAIAHNKHIVIVDTAGRLPTQLHLMDELKKVKKTLNKAKADAPHQVILVIDASNGQNALQQIKAFNDALGLTALIITKLDGTAKGGMIVAMAMTSRIPVAYIGVGEKPEDLRPFNPREFANALVGL